MSAAGGVSPEPPNDALEDLALDADATAARAAQAAADSDDDDDAQHPLHRYNTVKTSQQDIARHILKKCMTRHRIDGAWPNIRDHEVHAISSCRP